MEVQQGAAVAGGAFREDCRTLAGGQQRGDLGVDDLGVATAATAQENGIGVGRQPADQRPAAYFRLGHESDRPGGVDGVDVEPRDMIGHHQTARWNAGAAEFQAHAEDAQQLLRPALLEGQAQRLAGPWINHGHRGRPPQEVQHQAAEAEAASQAVGLAAGQGGW